MKNFKIIISKAIQEREISAYLNREMGKAVSNEFYKPNDFRDDLLLELLKLKEAENKSFDRDSTRLKGEISKEGIDAHVYHNYYSFCIDKNENRTFDEYLQEQYPIRKSRLQTEILQLTNKHNKIISDYKSVEIAINKITTQFEPEPDQLTTTPLVIEKTMFESLPDSNLPTIDLTIIDPEFILNKYHNTVFKCSRKAFYAWLVFGKKYEVEKIEWIFKKTGKDVISKAQLKMFIDKITNSNIAKKAYFKQVFDIEVNKSDYKEASLDHYFNELKTEIDRKKLNIK